MQQERAVCTNDDNLCKNKLDNGISDLNASLGLSQLEQYNDFLVKRQEIGNFYFEYLGDISKDLKQYFRFPIFVKNDIDFLNSEKVAFRKGVDALLHDYSKECLSNTEIVFKNTISIPIYPSLTKIQQKIIIDEVNK